MWSLRKTKVARTMIYLRLAGPNVTVETTFIFQVGQLLLKQLYIFLLINMEIKRPLKNYQSLFFHSIVLTSWNVVRDGSRLPRSPVSKAAALNPGFVYNLLEGGSNECIKHLIPEVYSGLSEYLEYFLAVAPWLLPPLLFP